MRIRTDHHQNDLPKKKKIVKLIVYTYRFFLKCTRTYVYHSNRPLICAVFVVACILSLSAIFNLSLFLSFLLLLRCRRRRFVEIEKI